MLRASGGCEIGLLEGRAEDAALGRVGGGGARVPGGGLGGWAGGPVLQRREGDGAAARKRCGCASNGGHSIRNDLLWSRYAESGLQATQWVSRHVPPAVSLARRARDGATATPSQGMTVWYASASARHNNATGGHELTYLTVGMPVTASDMCQRACRLRAGGKRLVHRGRLERPVHPIRSPLPHPHRPHRHTNLRSS